MNWAKAKLIEIETRLRDIADAREAKSKFMKNSKNPDFHTILVSSSSLQENGENMLMEVGGLVIHNIKIIELLGSFININFFRA